MKIWLFVIIFSAIATLGGLGYVYFNWSQEQLATLNQELSTQKVKNEEQDKTLQYIEDAQEEIKAIAERVESQQQEAEIVVSDLEQKFNKITVDGQRDLGRLAQARPDSIERIINTGTRTVFRCLEISTGAKLTEKEKEEYEATGTFRNCPGTVRP